jgi:hypothetical protein
MAFVTQAFVRYSLLLISPWTRLVSRLDDSGLGHARREARLRIDCLRNRPALRISREALS